MTVNIESVSQDSIELSSLLLSALRKRLEAADLDASELFEVGEYIRQVTNLQRGLQGVVKELRSMKKDAIKTMSNLPPEKQVGYLVRAFQALPGKYQALLLKQIEESR